MAASRVPIVAIVACKIPEFAIGRMGALPWKLPSEMKYFRQVTSDTFNSNKRNAVIMGRKTWDSIPEKFRPMKKRLNVVLSRSFGSDWEETPEGIIRSNSLQMALSSLQERAVALELERIYVIGGAEVYNKALPFTDYLLLTKVEPISESTRAVEMDTFLERDIIYKHFKENSLALQQFIPPSVTLPAGNGYISEAGYRYRFTLYESSVANDTNGP